MTRMIYKICSNALWLAAQREGVFRGAPVDLRDGYIHFSTADQLAETAARHFAGQDDLVLLAVDGAALGPALRWEPSRGNALFPHLYGDLPAQAVKQSWQLRRGDDGRLCLPQPTQEPGCAPNGEASIGKSAF